MNHISFAEFLEGAPCILGEGAVIERLRRNNDLKLDPYLVNSAFIYEDAKRVALETICRTRFWIFQSAATSCKMRQRRNLYSRVARWLSSPPDLGFSNNATVLSVRYWFKRL